MIVSFAGEGPLGKSWQMVCEHGSILSTHGHRQAILEGILRS